MERETVNILLIVMGTSGSGKSTVAEVLADKLNAPFIEGDDFHSPENKVKMASASPLQDEDRWPWLKAIRARILSEFSSHRPNPDYKPGGSAPVQEDCHFVVLSCSSLKKSYRDLLRNSPGSEEAPDKENTYYTLILYLKGSYDLILERLNARENHFAGPGLLKSQFSTLEEPLPEHESVVAIPISEPLSVIHALSFDSAIQYAKSLTSLT